jgi:hypothetical protein
MPGTAAGSGDNRSQQTGASHCSDEAYILEEAADNREILAGVKCYEKKQNRTRGQDMCIILIHQTVGTLSGELRVPPSLCLWDFIPDTDGI